VADAVICTSEGVRQEAVELCGANPARVFVVPNGVNTGLFAPDGLNARRRLGLDVEQRVVLFVGVLTPGKRADVLIEALRELGPEWRLVLVGRGPEEAGLRRLAAAEGTADRVRFLGYVPYPEMPALYRSADVLALPSAYEGCPKVVLEAMACGVPVAAAGFSLDTQGLQERMVDLTTDCTPSQCGKAIEQAQALGRCPIDVTAISWAARAEQVQAVYEAACAPRGRR